MTDKTELTTTLSEIRSHGPCEPGFAKIRDHFGVSPADAKTHDEPFPIALLLETNGLNDTLWVTARVAPEAITRFLIRRVNSALNSLYALGGDYSCEVEAIETVVSLLRRKLAGENVKNELRNAADAAADAAANATVDAARAAAYAADAAARAARAAADATTHTAADARARAAADAVAYAARAAADAVARGDLIAALKGDLT